MLQTFTWNKIANLNFGLGFVETECFNNRRSVTGNQDLVKKLIWILFRIPFGVQKALDRTLMHTDI